MSGIKTRFAPSPTGYLHIGGARTALFAWAYAAQHGGQFFLRIEDTDSVRSDDKHSQAIIEAMQWLGIKADAPPVFQSANRAAHQQKIQQLLDAGKAYYCYASAEELQTLREQQLANGESPKYDRRWRDSDTPPPPDVAPAVRFKMPLDGDTSFDDAIKGRLTVANSELDDFIIARADGTPTYNLAAVADDIDMEITHIIRGDDHVMNTYRQWHLFNALAPQLPTFAHMPMIFTKSVDNNSDADNVRYVRMSKRNATVDISQYRSDGFIAAAMLNYLARLSWAHGDAEVFTLDFFVKHFSFAAVSQSPARFDLDKLKWLNREHIGKLSVQQLRTQADIADTVSDEAITLIRARGDTLSDIKAQTAYFANRPPIEAAAAPLAAEHQAALTALAQALEQISEWQATTIKTCIKQTAAAHQLGFKHLGMPLRFALTGETESPDIAAIAAILGKQETLARLAAFLKIVNK